MSLHEVYRKLAENSQLSKEILSAKEKFSFKPFAIEYRPLYFFSIYGRWLLAVFSVVTGYTALYKPFSGTLPVFVAVPLAVLLLVGLEGLKSVFTGLAFRHWFTSNRFPVLAVPSLVCFALSVWLSLTGVQSLYVGLDTSGRDLENSFAARADSVFSYYDLAIKEEKQALGEFQKSVTWLGKVDMSNKATKNVINSHTQRIADLERERTQAREKMEADRVGALAVLEKETGFNVVFWVCLSGANELLILVSVWFLVYYAYRIAQDTELFSGASQSFSVSIADLQSFAEMVTLNHVNFQLPTSQVESPKQIGFKPVQNDQSNLPKNNLTPVQNTPLNPSLNGYAQDLHPMKSEAELRAFLAKYPQVVECVNRGVSTAQTALACGVSSSTVHNVKRCLRVLGE